MRVGEELKVNCPRCNSEIYITAGTKSAYVNKRNIRLRTGFCFKCEHYVDIENDGINNIYSDKKIKGGRE